MGDGRKETVKESGALHILSKETQGKESKHEPLKLKRYHCANVLFSPNAITDVGLSIVYSIVYIWRTLCPSTQNSLIVGGADDARLICLV